MPSWRNLPLPSASRLIATSISGLGAGPFTDGQEAEIRVAASSGSRGGPVGLVYDAARATAGVPPWVSEEFNVVRSADPSPIPITANFTTKQYMGSGAAWGFVSPRKVGAALATGLALEYRHEAFLQLNAQSVPINVGCVFYQLDSGDNTPTFTTPPTGTIGETAYLNGGATATGNRFTWALGDWAAMSWTTTPTKDMIYPNVIGFMNSGATTGGAMVDYALFMRYVGG